VEHTKKDEDEEISLDFTKLTSFFKRDKKGQKEEKKDDSKKKDLKEVSGFLAKYAIIILILVPILISSYYRFYPMDLPITDEWAKDNVENYIEQQVAAQVNAQHPNLPDENKKALVDKEVQSIYSTQGQEIEAQVAQTSQYFKAAMQDEKGDTYMPDIDTYLWYALANNYINDPSTGFGDAKNAEGENIFTLRNGRMEKGTTPLKFVPGFEVFLYKTMRIFSPDISLSKVTFYVPVILIALAIFPAFFIARKIAGNLAGFFAGMVIAINSALLARSSAGFSDTDSYNITFPLFIAWMFILAVSSKSIKKTVIFGTLTGLLIALYSLAWNGWGHIFIILVLVTLASLFYYAASHFKDVKEKGMNALWKIKGFRVNLVNGFTFILTSAIAITLVRDFRTFINATEGVLKFITLKQVAVTSLWPNVLTTVAEFNEVPLRNIIAQMGGLIFFVISLMGISLAFYSYRNKEEENQKERGIALILSLVWYIMVLMLLLNTELTILMLMILLVIPFGLLYLHGVLKGKGMIEIEYSTLLIIWFVATLYSFTQGTRFAILLVPSFAVAFGVALGKLYSMTTKMFQEDFSLDPYISKGVIIIIFCSLFFFPSNAFAQAEQVAKYEIPSMNDAWYQSLRGIHDGSEDAIITSWWDFGHWFFAISERRVTFDGADQGRRIHWVGRTLQTSDEDEAVGILRMLNCGQEESFQVFNKNFNRLAEFDPNEPNTVASIGLMYEIMKIQERTEAKKLLLESGFTEAGAEETLDYTHCEDLIDQFYIASDDMIGKAGVWGHFGSWDFKRAEIWQTISKIETEEEGVMILTERFNYSDPVKAANDYNEIRSMDADRWVSQWPSYGSAGMRACENKDDGTITCAAGIRIGDTGTQSIVLERAEIDPESMDAAKAIIGFYDKTTGRKLGEGEGALDHIQLVVPDGFETIKVKNTTIGFDIILAGNGDSYQYLIADPLLSGSIFTRLFFLEGHGLEHFTLFSHKEGVTGGDIYVYKVDLENKGEKNIYSGIVPPIEVRASHILVDSEEIAKEIIAQLDRGTRFDVLAGMYSKDATNSTGGDLGWFGKGMMIPEFENAAFALEKGEYSKDPVKSQFGYHIIKLTDKRGGKESLLVSE